MEALSHELEEEIRRRVAEGHYSSAEELLRQALKALDNSAEAAGEWPERELLKGLEGDDVEVTAGEFDLLRTPYLRRIADMERG